MSYPARAEGLVNMNIYREKKEKDWPALGRALIKKFKDPKNTLKNKERLIPMALGLISRVFANGPKT